MDFLLINYINTDTLYTLKALEDIVDIFCGKFNRDFLKNKKLKKCYG